MSERQRVSAKASAFKGQKSALPLESYGIDSAEQIVNFYLRNNQLNKINGNSLYSEVLVSSTQGGVTSLHGYKDVLFAQRGTDFSIAFVAQNYPAPASYFFVDSAPGFIPSGKRLYSCSWRDRIFFTNSQDAFCGLYQNSSSGGGLTISGNANFGLDPGTAATWTNDILTEGGAGSVDAGAHYYMVALYDQQTNSESVCSGALAGVDGLVDPSPNGFFGPQPISITSAGAKTVQLNGTKLLAHVQSSPSYGGLGGRATHFIVYRSKANVATGSLLFYRVPHKGGGTYDGSTIIPISAIGAPIGGLGVNGFVDSTADSGLLVANPTNNSPPPTPVRLKTALTQAQATYGAIESWALTDYSGFRHMRFFRDQLFGVGARSYGFTVNKDVSVSSSVTQKFTGLVTQFRDLLHGSEVYQPDYWPYRWEVGRGDGQEAIGLGVLGDIALLIFKEGSTYYLAGTSPDNFGVRIMDTQKGCISQGTIQETPVGVITLDRSGFVLWDKIGQGVRISEDIFDQILNIQFVHASSFYSCFDQKKGIYRCSVCVPGSGGTPNITFVLDIATMQWSIEQGTEGLSRVQFSINSNNLSASLGFAVDTGFVYDFVGSATNGRIYDYSLNTNVTNGGAAITAIWKSGTINFGDDQHKKRMKWIYLRAKAGVAWSVSIDVIPDYDESRAFSIANWSVVASNSLWYSSDLTTGSLLWDDGTGNAGGLWGSDGDTRYVAKIPISCVGYSFQIRITHNSTDAAQNAFAIESVSAEAVTLGR